MTTSTNMTTSAEEFQRRLREYREQASTQRDMPRIIYRSPFVICPWPNCGHSIAGIDFQLEKMGDPTLYQQLLDAWWKGAGLVGRCPGCANYVLFTMEDKQQVENPTQYAGAVLPDDWHKHAYFL